MLPKGTHLSSRHHPGDHSPSGPPRSTPSRSFTGKPAPTRPDGVGTGESRGERPKNILPIWFPRSGPRATVNEQTAGTTEGFETGHSGRSRRFSACLALRCAAPFLGSNSRRQTRTNTLSGQSNRCHPWVPYVGGFFARGYQGERERSRDGAGDLALASSHINDRLAHPTDLEKSSSAVAGDR